MSYFLPLFFHIPRFFSLDRAFNSRLNTYLGAPRSLMTPYTFLAASIFFLLLLPKPQLFFFERGKKRCDRNVSKDAKLGLMMDGNCQIEILFFFSPSLPCASFSKDFVKVSCTKYSILTVPCADSII